MASFELHPGSLSFEAFSEQTDCIPLLLRFMCLVKHLDIRMFSRCISGDFIIDQGRGLTYLCFIAVERTFLGYLRTSTALAMLGTVVAQIFTIQPQDNGLPHVSIGKPLATVFFGLAVVTVLLGAIRTFRHQSLLTNGKALAGGFEIHMIGLAFLSLLLACFGITLAMDNLPLANSV